MLLLNGVTQGPKVELTMVFTRTTCLTVTSFSHVKEILAHFTLSKFIPFPLQFGCNF